MVDDRYEGAIFRLPWLPPVERVGVWWRRRWRLTLISGRWQNVKLPPPLIQEPEAELVMVMTAARVSDTEVIIESFSREQIMAGGEMAYLSMAVIWLARAHSLEEVLINGMANHPLLSLSRISPEMAALLESEGY